MRSSVTWTSSGIADTGSGVMAPDELLHSLTDLSLRILTIVLDPRNQDPIVLDVFFGVRSKTLFNEDWLAVVDECSTRVCRGVGMDVAMATPIF